MLNTDIIHALARHLDCNFARLKCLSLLISAVLRHRTVNLCILATTPDAKNCSNQSRYRRFQDFFLRFSLCLDSVSKCILARIPKPPEGFTLAMDRTNWQFGRRDINYLVISIIVGKVSIPIVWTVLPAKTKRGNSNASQRIALAGKLLKHIPAGDIHVLTMDREFHGKQWLSWLDEMDVAYVLRIKKNIIVGSRLAGEHATARGRKPSLRQRVFGSELFFGSKKVNQGGRSSHLMVVSNRFKATEAMALYKRRWGIERLFGHLKKKGFDLEATHMTDGGKLEKLFAIVTLAFTYSYAWGAHLRSQNSQPNAALERKSLFRLGMEDILNMIQPSENDPLHSNRRKNFLRWLAHEPFNSIFLV